MIRAQFTANQDRMLRLELLITLRKPVIDLAIKPIGLRGEILERDKKRLGSLAVKRKHDRKNNRDCGGDKNEACADERVQDRVGCVREV